MQNVWASITGTWLERLYSVCSLPVPECRAAPRLRCDCRDAHRSPTWAFVCAFPITQRTRFSADPQIRRAAEPQSRRTEAAKQGPRPFVCLMRAPLKHHLESQWCFAPSDPVFVNTERELTIAMWLRSWRRVIVASKSDLRLVLAPLSWPLLGALIQSL